MMGTTEQVFYGTIKSYNSEKGWGHIDCDQTRHIYGKDMFVLRSQLSGARVAKGDQVEFRVRQGQMGPEATSVRIINSSTGGCPGPPGPAAPGPMAPEMCGAGGMGGPCGHVQAAPPLAAAPYWGSGGSQPYGCHGGCGQMWAGGCAPAPVGAPPQAAAMPAAGPFTGMVRGFAPDRGWGYIQSEQSQQIFGRDVLVVQAVLGGGVIQDGDTVRFTVRMETEGPVAAEVQVIASAMSAPQMQAAPPQQHPWGPPPMQAGGCAWGGPAPGAAMWGAAPAASPPVAGLPPAAMPSPNGAMPLGSGAMPPNGGAMPGTDGFMQGGMANGTAVPSSAPLWGPGASQPEWGGYPHHYGQAPAPAQAHCGGGYGGHLWGSQAAQPMQQAPYAPPPAQDKQVFFGVVKAFDEDKGWGHISCDVTRQMFGKDMFVLRSSLHGTKISPGDEVQFALRQGLRGVEATEVRPLSRGPAAFSWDEAVGREFVGILKMFDNTKGWGFLECDESRQLYGKDIFVHKREFPKGCTPDNGDRLRFIVERGRDARPEARRVTLDGPGIDAAHTLSAQTAPAVADAGTTGMSAGAVVGTAPPPEDISQAVPCGPELPPYGAMHGADAKPVERASPY